MKIPKYIEQLLNQRADCAMKFMKYDYEISEWLENNNIKVSSDIIYGGVRSIYEPYTAIQEIKETIINKE